jgi:hypothetical protein
MTVPGKKVAPPPQANDNFSMWQQGLIDSKSQVWSDELANRPGAAGLEYLAGWISHNK